MASISVVLLGLNPETRLKSVVDYLKRRGVPGEASQGAGVCSWGRALGRTELGFWRLHVHGARPRMGQRQCGGQCSFPGQGICPKLGQGRRPCSRRHQWRAHHSFT